MPTTPARDREDQADDTHIAKTAVSSEARPKRVRAKPAVKVAPSQSTPQKGGERELDVAKVALVRARKSASPLLIGAGIGAAVALSVVALRSRDKRPTVALFASPNSTFFNAIVKTVAFAVAQSTAKGSLAGLVARAVGKAVA
jgi:hypothetical protein